jgi:hypothetical protein
MTANARSVLAAFESLPREEQQQVAAEIIRRTGPVGDLSDAALDELAGEVFRGYDAEEAARADP